MNFKFDLRGLFKHEITKLDNTLLPHGFRGDRRQTSACIDKLAHILDNMGAASARAQGLLKAITSWEKLRNSNHVVYLLVDIDEANENNSVIGLLKMGKKRLYVFDECGECHEIEAMCVLDFYVHESKQRMGCGKKLFEHMLLEESVTPEQLAIDRPSEKFLFFLQKHYGLSKAIQQTNNFVVFRGFFPEKSFDKIDHDSPLSRSRNLNTSANSSLSSPGNITYNGRHTAQKPESTVGKIIHSI